MDTQFKIMLLQVFNAKKFRLLHSIVTILILSTIIYL